MSSPDPEVVRELLKAEGAKDGGYTRLSRALGGTPTRQALQQFADGDTEQPRYLGRLWRLLSGALDALPGVWLIRRPARIAAKRAEQNADMASAIATAIKADRESR